MDQTLTIEFNSNTLEPHALETAMDVVLYSLSETSKRQYGHTYATWLQWAETNGVAPSAMTPRNIIDFLEDSNIAHRTKQARMAHIRKLLEALHAQQPDNPQLEALYKQARLLKIKRQESTATEERPKHALKPMQAFQAFSVFSEDSALHIRNRALLAILVYAGLRRNEAATLRWADLDLDEELVTIRHGKGDKARTIPILGGIDYLREWKAIAGYRTFVFASFYKGDKLRPESPKATHGMTTQAIYAIIQHIGDALGIEGLSPHDLRRTLITNGLNNGASVADMQFIAGHANPQTTLEYAQVKDAKEVAGRVKLSY